MYTLVVIDMQEEFLELFGENLDEYGNTYDSRIDIIYSVRDAVKQAIKDNAEIIDVNYIGSYGSTVSDIAQLFEGYNKLKTVEKENNGGGREIMNIRPANQILRICGINLGACVRETVYELIDEYNQNVQIIKDAVANAWGHETTDLLRFENILI